MGRGGAIRVGESPSEGAGAVTRRPTGMRALWSRLRAPRPGPRRTGPVRMQLRYLGGEALLPPGPARLEVWPTLGGAVLWSGRRHLAFGLGTVAKVALHDFARVRGTAPLRTAVGVLLQYGRVSRTLWLTAPAGGGEEIYLELLVLLRPSAPGRPDGAAAPPQAR